MKTLIVYYSWSKLASTEKAAKCLAEKFAAQTEKLVDKNEKRGAIGWVYSGRKAFAQKTTELEPIQANLDEFDMIAIGGPVWAWNIAPPIRTFLATQKFIGKKILFFCTMGSSGDQRSFANMKALLGEESRIMGELSLTAKEAIKGEYKEKIDKFYKALKSRFKLLAFALLVY